MIQFRRGTASAASTANEVLAAGQPFVETDTSKLKIGDGSTAFNDLPYIGGSGGKKYATVVVGTSTAGYTADQVDFLCDGVDDQVEINAALQLSLSDTDTISVIYLLPGTYNISESIMFPNYPYNDEGQAILVGSGQSYTTIMSTVPPIEGVSTDGTRTQSSMNNSYAILMRCKRNTLMNLTIKSDVTPWLVNIHGTRNLDYDRFILNQLNFVSELNGVCAQSMNKITVSDCSFSCAISCASFWVGCSNVVVDHCYFQDCKSGISVQGGSDNFVISNNYIFTETSSSGISSDECVGIYVDAPCTIHDNYIRSYTGVYLDSSGNVSIANNHFDRVTTAVDVVGSSGNTITGNTCSGYYYLVSGERDYSGTFINIRENSWGIVVSNNIPDGLMVFATIDATSHHNLVTDNIVSLAAGFMQLQGNHNIVSNNISYNDYDYIKPYNPSYYSIRLTGSNNIVTYNTLDYSQSIQDSGSSNTVVGNIVSVQH